ncbi:MAG: cache domain-containing protein [Desulfobacterales bacterium]|nr:cache domain-containing protein [Desulfobacterales bacterium]
MIRHSLKKWLQMAPIRIILPVMLTVVLFIGTIFLLILPILEARMLDDRRVLLRELNQTAWSLLAAYQAKEEAGEISHRDAQTLAIETLRELRYGPESKDYFWINDLQPILIMHPYRPDLEGQDVSDFTDPNGKRLFAEVVKTVRQSTAGFVDYQWQWKDDPQRIVSKISHVKEFKPWGWVVGTGIYVEDVRAEIAAITRRLTKVCLGILAVILLLSWYIIRQSAKGERRRREIHLALRESEHKYRLLAETASEFIIAFDHDGRILYVNRAWVATGGYCPQATSQQSIFELIPADAHETFKQRVGQLQSGAIQQSLFETELTTAAGAQIPVEVTLVLLNDDDLALQFFITARDITEKKTAEKQARIHHEQLFQADKMATLGTLVSGVAHEINNPVTSIMLNATILQKAWHAVLPILDRHRQGVGDFKVGGMTFSVLQDRMPLLLESVADGARRVKVIVEDLKDFSRQSPPQMHDRIDINLIVNKAIGLLGNLIKQSTRRFESDFGRDIPIFMGNAQKIEQVFINLIVNACQSLPDRDRGVRIATACDQVENRIVIQVSDEGCGIPEESLQRIRDPFFTTKREAGGTGLGLAIVDRIVRDHGGQISFDSTVGQGTTARVFLPLEKIESNPRDIL